MDEMMPVDESMNEVVDAQKRNLDQWCFAEHFEPHVLLQVILYNILCHRKIHCFIIANIYQLTTISNCNHLYS